MSPYQLLTLASALRSRPAIIRQTLSTPRAVAGRLITPLLATLAMAIMAPPLCAQESRATVFGVGGAANITSGDSVIGNTFLWGGGASVRLASFAVEGDVTTASFNPDRFGTERRTTMITGSALYFSGKGAVHLAAGGGVAARIQRTRSQVSLDPSSLPAGFCQSRSGSTCREIHPGLFEFKGNTTINMLHGRVGVRWDVSPRVQFRTDAVLWFGEGLSAAVGAMTGLGYRF